MRTSGGPRAYIAAVRAARYALRVGAPVFRVTVRSSVLMVRYITGLFLREARIQDRVSLEDGLYFLEDYVPDGYTALRPTALRVEKPFASGGILVDAVSTRNTTVRVDTINIAETRTAVYSTATTEAVGATDAGYIYVADYVDGGYFAGDYVGSTTLF